MEKDEKFIELIVKFLTDEASENEKEALLAWASESAENKKLYVELKDIWEVVKAEGSTRFDGTQAWQKFVDQLDKKKKDDSKPRKLIAFRNNFLRIAAAVVVTFSLSWAIFSSNSNQPKIQAVNEINVPLGSKTQIVLPDGSKVWINSGSKLSYKTNFNESERVLDLTGEAFFEVVKNPKKPFIVKTGALDVKAYGTSFNVKSYPDDDYVETTLVEGIVTIENESDNKQIAKLKPNQKTLLRKEDGKESFDHIVRKQKARAEIEKIVTVDKNIGLILAETRPESLIAWKEQKLFFNSEALEEIVPKLERWYGVEIHLQSESLKKEQFTGKFIHNEPIAQVLDAIRLTNNRVAYLIKQNNIYIYEKGN